MYRVRVSTHIPGYEDFSTPYEYETNRTIKEIYHDMVSQLRAVYKMNEGKTRYIVYDENNDIIFWGYVRSSETKNIRVARLNSCAKYGNFDFNW